MLPRYLSWLLLAIANGSVLAVSGKSDSNSTCDCFLTNGTQPTYYTNHLFFDFRSLSQYASEPPAVQSENKVSAASITSDYFRTDVWTKNWAIQNWHRNKGHGDDESSHDATVDMINSASNIYVETNADEDANSDTYLTMRTKRLQRFQTAAEFVSTDSSYQFMSLRMYARTVGSKGAVAAMFTYKGADDPEDVQEADIEILTGGPAHKIQYTNQPSNLPDRAEARQATVNASIPGGMEWSDWAVHRLDWTPQRSVWYFNGEKTADIDFQVPRDSSNVIFNMWSNGGSWSGNMSIGNEAKLQIQWIELVYNTTDRDDGQSERRSWSGSRNRLRARQDHCGVVCSIDKTREAGTTAVLYESSAASKTAFGHEAAVITGGLLVFALSLQALGCNMIIY